MNAEGAMTGQQPDAARTSTATIREGAEGRGSIARKGLIPAGACARMHVEEALPTAGAEADLYRGSWEGQAVVLKVYRYGIRPSPEAQTRITAMKSRHVARILDRGEDEGRCWEMVEYIAGGTLRDRMNGPLALEDAKRVIADLAAGLSVVHGAGLEHRDLKPENLLVRDGDGAVVIADFGIASVPQGTLHFTRAAHTVGYAPPEAMGSGEATVVRTKWDWWSVGMLAAELVTGRHPLGAGADPAKSYRLATAATATLVEGVPEEGGWKELCKGLLARDPAVRWGASEVEAWLGKRNAARDRRGEGRGEVELEMRSGRLLRFAYRHTWPLDVGGRAWISRAYLLYWIGDGEDPGVDRVPDGPRMTRLRLLAVDRMAQMLQHPRFRGRDMARKMSGVVPAVAGRLHTRTGGGILLEKDPAQVPLIDVVELAGGFDARHAAWVTSRLAEIACWLETVGVAHHALHAENLLVDPEKHTLTVPGGWWFATCDGRAAEMLPARSARLTPTARQVAGGWPSNARARGRGGHVLDRWAVHSITEEVMGPRLGEAPEPIRRWMAAAPARTAIEDYARWCAVLEEVWGDPRRRAFCRLGISAEDVYSAWETGGG